MVDNACGPYAVIMAGGRGERFWPQSRLSHPKQLLRLLGNLTLIEQTVERVHGIFPYERIMIITTPDYVAPMRTVLTNVPPENILSEPEGKDTAPCVAYAAAKIRATDKADPVLCVFPSDLAISDRKTFAAEVTDCITRAASHDEILTIGIRPGSPSTGFGYLHIGRQLPDTGKTVFRQCLDFKEKPDPEQAQEYVDGGDHLWNSGIFIFRMSVVMKAFQTFAPDIYRFSVRLDDIFAGRSAESESDAYAGLKTISIDYSIMEKVRNITVAEGLFDWDDIGTWTSMRTQIQPGEGNNVIHGLHVGLNTKNSIIVGGARHLIATADVDDMIIVHTEDATLVCNGKSAQKVRELVRLIADRPDLQSFL